MELCAPAVSVRSEYRTVEPQSSGDRISWNPYQGPPSYNAATKYCSAQLSKQPALSIAQFYREKVRLGWLCPERHKPSEQ